MSEENRQQQSSAESTVAGAAKTGKAIASIAKGAATGGAHGAAVEAAKSSRKWTIPIVAVILLPVLIIAMLPSVIFGSLFGDGTDTPNGISDDTVLVQNLADINSGISMILSAGLDDVLARIDSDFAASGCDGKEVNNPFGSDVVFNANAIVSQYCAYKDTDATSISKDDMESLLAANKDKLYSFTYFCIVSDQDSTFDFLSSLFFSFLFIRLIRYADGYCEGGMLSTKVKFVLDEFPNCCLIPDFTKKCSTIRSRGCSVAVFFQNVGQMRNRYPDDQWQEILGACDSTVFLGCTDMLTAEYFSDRIGTASVEVEGTMRELNTMHITNYTPRFRKTNSLGRRQLLTPDEVLRLPPDQVLIFIRGQKVMRAKRYDYSLHPDYKKLKSRKAILHEPDWKTSQASSVSATGPSPSSSMATPVEKGSGNRQKKPPAKPARNTEREVVNADDIF